MTAKLQCYRCGASLESLPLPLSRRDECPRCAVHLHACRMCRFFDRHVPKQCLEDDAEEVLDKEKVNFCEWFILQPNAFDPARARGEARARSELAALFGEGDAPEPGDDDLLQKAEDLFR